MRDGWSSVGDIFDERSAKGAVLEGGKGNSGWQLSTLLAITLEP